MTIGSSSPPTILTPLESIQSASPIPSKRKNSKLEKSKKSSRQKIELTATTAFPPHFIELEKVFKALNTVSTFWSSKKEIQMSWDLLKGSVENIIKRPLLIDDVAQIKALVPYLITFAYCDPESLRIHSDRAVSTEKEQKRKEVDKAYSAASGLAEIEKDKNQVVLQFSFDDSELKSSNGVGKLFTKRFSWKKPKSDSNEVTETAKPNARPKEAVYTVASMTAIINKRNIQFSQAVNELILSCAAHNPEPLNPVELLLEAARENIPVLPPELDGIKSLADRKDDLQFYQRNPEMRSSVIDVMKELGKMDWYDDQICGQRTLPERAAAYGQLSEPLSVRTIDALILTLKSGSNCPDTELLYSHQAEATNLINAGKSIILVSSTASGKSLIFQLPILRCLEAELEFNDVGEPEGYFESCFLYIFPTKALAQDQKRSLSKLLHNFEGGESVKIATFDGDTDSEDRDYIRENVHVMFSNPDMLHLTILPQEIKWRRFLKNLKFVVVDELHSYSGLFGVHVSFIMRRLRRICAALGNRHLQFISCSATINNPVEHMEKFFNISGVEIIDIDGSPRGRKECIIWNPPFIETSSKQRVSTVTESSRLFRFLIERGFKTILFCKVRKMCELMMKQIRADLILDNRHDLAAKIMSYRSGYSAEDRREIEKKMSAGELFGIVATTALELGIDIGSLDCVLSLGFYTLAGLRQQQGRAGRRATDSLAILICDPFPLGQHYAFNPDKVFDSAVENSILQLDNPMILESHIQLAANEIPINAEDTEYFGNSLMEICKSKLKYDDGYYFINPSLLPNPAAAVKIRNTEEEEVYTIIDVSTTNFKILEEIPFSRAIFTCYEGAVYYFQGFTYLCLSMNHHSRIARVKEIILDYTTRQLDYQNIDIIESLGTREIEGSDSISNFGKVRIESIVTGYRKLDKRNNILDTVQLHSPSFIRQSHGVWLEVNSRAIEILDSKNIDLAASIHSAEHALMSLTPLIAMSSAGDIKTNCKLREFDPDNLQPNFISTRNRIILYDTGNSGICSKIFDHLSGEDGLLRAAAFAISNCKCIENEGCDRCVASQTCSNSNTFASKLGALVILQSLLNMNVDTDVIPVRPNGTKKILSIKRSTQGEMEDEEETAQEELERIRVLQAIMG